MKKEEIDYLKIEGMFAGATAEVRKFAIQLRANTTESENKLWDYLKTKPNGLKFRRQHPFNLYILDFYCHKLRLAIEIDGGYHFTRLQQEKDRDRTLEISKYKVDVIRFTDIEVIDDYPNVIDKIDSVIKERLKTSNL
ncbi:very-short-patch-repair endonuclease [Nonlabens dokdonensis]|uniref:Very-short-patch-repair endonuclease n=2 Tax=Nonlabens dokdonensis TaxID=328515 RepID=A0ABX5Q1Y8_9FLAO|nr:endonuclease domain-containing protein [Nonlabens dokdonensis]AGC76304.1 putative DNA methylase [Nonlabens dokdonensis DSW-6]PZX43966.1 very-short-patch-repair endonuclease [Nonlabens dokdonensis]